MPHFRRRLHRNALAALLLSMPMATYALSPVWNGATITNQDMTVGGNWVGGVPPTAVGDSAIFPAGVAAANSFPFLESNNRLSLREIQFTLAVPANSYNISLSTLSSIEFADSSQGLAIGVSNLTTNATPEFFYLTDSSILFRNDSNANASGATHGTVTYNIGPNSYIAFFDSATASEDSIFNLTDNGTIDFNQNSAVTTTFLGSIQGAGIVNIDLSDSSKILAFTANVANPSTLVGPINVVQGTLTDSIDNSFPTIADYVTSANGTLRAQFNETIGSVAGNGIVRVDPNVTLILNNASNTDFSGQLQGTGTITKSNLGVFTLSGSDNSGFTGILNIQKGTLQAGTVNTLPPTGTLNLTSILDLNGYNNTIGTLIGAANSTIALGAGTLTIADGNSQTFSGKIYGSGGLTLNADTLTLSGTNTYSGPTTINSPNTTLFVGTSGALSPNSDMVINGSTAALALNNTTNSIGSLSGSGNIFFANSSSLTVNNDKDTTFSGTMTSTGGGTVFRKQGDGVLTLSGATTYTGSTFLNNGTLKAGSSNALSGGSSYTLSPNTTLDLNNFPNTIASLAGDGGSVVLGTATLTTGTTGTTFGGSISGTGGLSLTGSNSLTLSGSNSYSGTTNLAGSTSLIAGARNSYSPNSNVVLSAASTSLNLNSFDNEIGSLAGSGSVVLSGTLTLTRNVDTSFSGGMSGAGGLIKKGSGIFTLTGTNNKNYSGLTQIQSGTIRANSINAFSPNSLVEINSSAQLNLNNFSNAIGPLSGAGIVELGTGTLTIKMTESTTFAGDITGNGGIIIQDTSTLTLSGTNSYLGDTEIDSDAKLAAGATNSLAPDSVVEMTDETSSLYLNNFDNTIGALSGDGLVDLGTAILTMGSVDSTTFSGVITGTGGINKVGDTTLTLEGTNTYQGITTISEGTLISINGSIPSTSPIVDNAELIFDQDGDYTHLAPISGTGSVTVTGDGSMTLLGCNTYSGGTTVDSDATLIGNSHSLQGAIEDNGTLIFDQKFNGAFNGTITGIGDLIKTGCGQLAICTDSPAFTGLTSVNQGVLALNALLGGNMDVNNGGTLAGIGTVGSNLTIKNGGTISPGNGSPGTLHVGGNFTQNSGSTYVVHLDFLGNSSLIDVNGTATLNGGDVLVSPNSCFNIYQEYVILNADQGRTGEYDSVTGYFNTAYPYKPLLFYTDNQVLLEIVPAFLECVTGHCSINQRQIAAQFDAINDLKNIPADLLNILNTLLTIPAPEICCVLDQLSGEAYASNFVTSELINRQFIRRLYDPIRRIVTNYPFCNPCNEVDTMVTNCADFWIEASGGQICSSRRGGIHGFTMDGFEVTGGIQKTFSNSITAGAAVSFEYDTTHFHRHHNAKTYTAFGGLYGLYTGSCGYLLGDIAYGYSQHKLDRSIQFATYDFKAKGRPSISEVTAYTEAGTDYFFFNALVQPFVALEVDYFNRCRFNEKEASHFNLHFRNIDYTNAFSRVGFHITNSICNFDFSADLAWQCRLNHRSYRNTSEFEGFGSAFDIFGAPIARSSFDGAFTASSALNDNFRVYAEVSGQVWSHLSTYNVVAGLEAFW